MNYAGQDLKFKVTSEFPDFSLAEDYFEIIIKDRWGNVAYAITKEDCFADSDNNYYIPIENVKNGVFYAFFKGEIGDDDYIKQVAIIADEQFMFSVGVCDCGCGSATSDTCQCGHKVHYEQVWAVNLDDGIYLVGSDGAYILTSDGQRIRFDSAATANTVQRLQDVNLDTLTGEEFKQLIEQTTDDGKTDTLPEVFNMLSDIPDGQTVGEYIQEQMPDEASEEEVRNIVRNYLTR